MPTNSPGWGSNLSTNPYTVNVSASIANGSFDRVAYYLELVKATGETQWIYVSSSAFTANASHLGIPRSYVLRYGAYDTVAPSNAVIRSNVSGITNGDGINTVNLEFWPSNYGQSNDYNVPNASASTFDFGDGGSATNAGHGSMQIHNYGAGQTLFAYNNWGTSQNACSLGVGNQIAGSGNPDWTFNYTNIANYTSRTLQVLVRQLGVNNAAATGVTDTTGWMNGRVDASGTNCAVYVFWGGSDGGADAKLWSNSAYVGSYTNGAFNVAKQATGLTGGVVSYYTFMASNATTIAWATPTASFTPATAPSIDNSLGGTSASAGQASLRGTLTAGGTADIYVYWGLTDGGQSTNYEHVVKVTDVPQGSFSVAVSSYAGFAYHYICFASNAAGTAWSPSSSTFSFQPASTALDFANGLRGSIFQPVTFSQVAVDLTGSTYTDSVSRVMTGGKAGTVLAMTEVAGRNIVLQGPANSWNEFGGSPGDTFVAALSGRFCPPVSGTYTFRWSQDDRGWLFMDTGNDGVFDLGDIVGYYQWNCTATRTLMAGQSYPFMFFSQESAGGDNIAFWYTPPGGVETYVCPSAQAGQWKYPYRTKPAVSIANGSVASLTDHSATLQGSLSAKDALMDVFVFWGRSNGGTVAGGWETNAYVGRVSNWNGTLTFPVDGLAADTSYYYTFFVTNDFVGAWASPVQTFVPGAVTLEATDASASETGDTGCFRVSRPASATSGPLTVFYTLSGTAANGVDYATLSGSVTIPDGATGADIVVSPLADSVWSEGAETVTATLAAGNYVVGTASSATVTIQDAAFSADDFSLRLPIRFSGYNRAETLTNFPALVTLGANLSGFNYGQFLSGPNGDLRFVDDSLTRELPYEIERWDASGLSRVWVQVPRLTNNATVWMLWRKSGQTAPAYTTNGAVWSAGYILVAHHSEAFGGAADSTAYRNNGAQSGLMIQDVPGVIAGGDVFDGADDLLTFGTAGRATNTFSYSAWVQTVLSHEVDAESNSSSTGTSGQKWAFEAEYGIDNTGQAGSGLSVGTNGISVYEHASGYMPPLAVYSGIIGTNWNHITVVYTNRAPCIFLNGQLVRTGLQSQRVQVNSPFRLGGNNYGYFAGGIDETRVSSVARSANWVWAEYMNAASNSVLATYGVSQPPTHAYPDIANLPASGVSAAAATLNGYLSSTGVAQTAVAVYWGAADGGTDAGAWANTNWFAAPAAAGAFTKDISGLAAGATYFFRFAASNAYGVAWAPTTETLLTGEVTLQASDASAAEYPQETGTITVSRGVAQDSPLTVLYTLSGTAVNGSDMTYLSGSVTIPAGAATADIVVSPLNNRNYQVRATDTVTLTLASGGYVSGSPNAGTVTITNWQPTSTAGFDVPRNFTATSAAPLTGADMFTKTGAGNMFVGGSVGNTFSGDIVVDTDGGMMRVGAIPGAASGIGVTLPNMTAANTITVRRGSNFQIEDNVNGSVSSAPNRFGTEGNRPAVALNGGTLTLNGANYNAMVPQNFSTLSLGSGFSTINAIRNSGAPELVFTSAAQAKGSHVNFTSSSGNAMGSSTNAAPHVRFTTPPTLLGGGGSIGSTTLSVMPGARYGSDFVTHDAVAGIRPLSTAEYRSMTNNDINAAAATENVKLSGSVPSILPPLLADKAVNALSLSVGASANWTPTNKLTLTSGQLLAGLQNQQMVVNYPGTLTAGSGSSDASLDISVINNNTYIRTVITDNGNGKITLTKNGGGTLVLDGSADSSYSGGTYLNEGTLTTGGTLNRRFLGAGPVRVDAGILNLGQAGATANASGADYTAVNGGQIQIATVPYFADDTFAIGSGCVIYGGWYYGQGLNALDRGMGVPATTPNITLGQDAIIAHNYTLTAPLNLYTNTVRNLGTNCDLYYGIIPDQNNAGGSITIGKGTAFKGVSTDRSDRRWAVGTINVTPGTDEITLQGMARPGTTPNNLYMGNWLVAGGPVIAPAGPLIVNLLGSIILEDNDSVYGDTSAGKPVIFAVKSGATAQANRQNALGSGTGIASMRVEDGGTLQFGVPSAINGNVTVQAGGRLLANNGGGMTGSGTITMAKNSVIELTSATGLTGSQADALAASLLPGQVIRLNVGGFGSALDPLDAHVGSKSPIYEVFGGNNGAANPLVPGTTVMTLNRDAGTGVGGMLINDYAGRTMAGTTDGILTIGPNGGTIAATSNTTFQIDQRFALGANALTIGATDVLDRVQLPRLGTVYFTAALGLNTALPGSSITVIPGATLMNTGNAIPDEPDVTVNGTFLLNGTETIGSLGGSGWVNLQGNSLNVGRNNNSSTFSGTLTNSSLSSTIIKTGSGRLDITSPQPIYTGLFTVNGGTLAFSGNGVTTNTSLSAYTIYDNGTLLLDNSAVNLRTRLAGLLPCVTFNGGTFRFVGKNGEAAGEKTLGAAIFNSGEALIDVVNGSGSGSSSELEFGGLTPGFGTVKFTASNGTLGAAGDNPRVLFDGQPAGVIGCGMVGAAPAYYDPVTGVRAYTLAEGTEFDGTADQTGVDTKYTSLNNHLALNAARSVSSLWIDSPGAGYVLNLGDTGTNSLKLTSGRLTLTGSSNFAVTRGASSTGVLTRDLFAPLFFGVDAGRTLTLSVPVANGAGPVAKDGPGTLVLNAANTFSGTLSINEGTVRYASGGTNDLNGNAVNIWNGGVLDINGDTDTLGALAIYNGGLTNSGSYGTLTLGAVTLGGGPAGSSTFMNSGTGTNKLGGTLTFNSANDPNTAFVSGALDMNSANAARYFTINNSYAPGAAVDMEISAKIFGASSTNFTKNGGGVLKLSGANAFDSSLVIQDSGGTIIAAHPQALGAPSVGRYMYVGVNDSLVFDGSNGNITLPALYTNVFLSGQGDYQIGVARGEIVNWSGTNTVASPMISLLSSTTYLASLGGKLIISSMITNLQDLATYGGGDMEFSGPVLTGVKTLTKNGAGTLTLSGTAANNQSNTTVNVGTLLLAKANGTSPVNACGDGILTINNGATVRYAASSTNPDMIGTNQININASGVLDFNGSSDLVGPVNISSGGAVSDTTAITNSTGGGTWTVNNLFITPTPGYITRVSSGSGTIALNSSNIVFYSSGNGRARISGNLSLGSATRYLTTAQGVHPDYDLAIDAVISGAAGSGIIKDSVIYSWGTSTGGSIRFEGANTFDGNVTINDSSKGSLILANNQALGVPSTARTVTVGYYGSLALDGGISIYDPSDRITLALKGTGDSRLAGNSGVNSSQSGALFGLGGTNTVPCKITLLDNTQIGSQKRLVLKGVLNGGGKTLTVAGPGETAFAGGALVTNVSSITLSANATLSIENTAAANSADRITNTVPFTLNGGGIRFANGGGAANYTEAIGAVTVNTGTNVFYASRADVGQTSALVIASITRNGGTVNFTGEGLGEDARNRIFITSLGEGQIGPWATINGTNLAMYSVARGVYAGSVVEYGVAALGGTAASVIPEDASGAAVINTMGSEGPITVANVWTNRILEVRQATAYPSVVRMVQGVTNRTLQTSRISIGAGMASVQVGENDNEGALMALGTGGILTLENLSSSATLAVKSAIPNNGTTASGLSKFGPGTVVLSGSNSYAGATIINEGTLEFGGALAQRLQGAISGAGTLVKSGTNLLQMMGANSSFTGPIFVNAGIIRPDQNSAFGSTVSGTYIANGATLDLGCDSSVGGTKAGEALYLNREEFTVGGAGVGGAGAIVNNGNATQMNAINRVFLSDDTTFGGKMRWDIRNDSPYLFFNDHTLTKTGVNEIAIIAPVYPGSGKMVINQGLVRIEASAVLGGSASNTVTVNSGGKLEIYNLYPAVPPWSLVLNEGGFFNGAAAGTVATNYNVWGGPVKLNGKAFLYGTVSGVNWSIPNEVSGAGTLVKCGNSGATLWLNNVNNTYSGGTIISNGTLYAKYPTSLPGYNDGRLTFGGDGFLAFNASDGTSGFTPSQLFDLYTASTFTTNTSGLSIDTSLNNFTIGHDLVKPMALMKQGTNTLTLAGNSNTYGGITYVGGGTLRFNSTTGTNNTLKLLIGYNNTNASAVVQEGGISDIGATSNYVETLAVGSGGTGSYGYYRKNGGTLTTGWLSVPGNNGFNGVFEQYGGDTYVTGLGSWLIMGWVNVNNGASVINLFGGTLRNTAAGNDISMNHNASRNSFNMINVLGPTAVLDANSGKSLRLTTSGTNVGSVVNLNAGAIVASRVYAGVTWAPSIFNFNGGTLRANASRVDFLQGLTAATVYPGGAVFDTAGSDVAVYQPLLAPIGYGLGYVPLRSGGTGYVGAPAVLISGGSGTGATAIATVDVTEGSPTKGTVTGISVTSPGSGYQPTDKLAVTLFGGGSLWPAVTNDCALSLNSNVGGLTKLGLGTLTLVATNTYGGATVISNGVLALGVREALPTGSVVKVDGGILNLGGLTITNRSLTVTSGGLLNGKLVCDSVTKTGGGQWTLGTSIASPNPIVVAEGSLKLQSAQPGLYEGTLSGAFNTSEGFSLCSNVTVQLSTRMANTNIKQPTGPWGDFMTIVYSGYIWNRTGTNATWTFGESIDDSTQVKIDSTIVINGGSGWDVPTIGTYTLTPGAHPFEVRFGNGPGGAGLVPNKMWWTSSTLGFGIDYQGHAATNIVNLITNFVSCADPGDGSLLSCTATSSGSSNLLDSATALVLGSNTLVNLDGYVQTLSGLSGFGTVSNGTLLVTGDIAPGGVNAIGELTIAAGTTLGSGTLRLDVNGDASGRNSDKLIVRGSVDLTKLNLMIANPESLDRSKSYTIMSCTGTRAGTAFKSANLPDSRWHVALRSNGDVQLIFANGTLIRLR